MYINMWYKQKGYFFDNSFANDSNPHIFRHIRVISLLGTLIRCRTNFDKPYILSWNTYYYIPINIPCLDTVNFVNLIWFSWSLHCHFLILYQYTLKLMMLRISTLWNWWRSGSVLSETDDVTMHKCYAFLLKT
jgi:hypothetical protein